MTKYIIRLDDSHPKQNFEKWHLIEIILDKYNIKPIVAIIPLNKDNTICSDNNYFVNYWSYIKKCQDKSYKMALHGLNHNLKPSKSLLYFSIYSEYTGKSYQEQYQMIKEGLSILNYHGIQIKYFIAPGHGYDSVTLKALYDNNKEIIVSDGYSYRPFIRNNIKFIPQQIWKFFRLPFGVWTICLHPTNMTYDDIINFEKYISCHYNSFIFDFEELEYSNFSFKDYIFEYSFILVRKIYVKFKKSFNT
jgi:hypothetical protein